MDWFFFSAAHYEKFPGCALTQCRTIQAAHLEEERSSGGEKCDLCLLGSAGCVEQAIRKV